MHNRILKSQNISVTGSFNVSRKKGDAKIASVIGCAKKRRKREGGIRGGRNCWGGGELSGTGDFVQLHNPLSSLTGANYNRLTRRGGIAAARPPNGPNFIKFSKFIFFGCRGGGGIDLDIVECTVSKVLADFAVFDV